MGLRQEGLRLAALLAVAMLAGGCTSLSERPSTFEELGPGANSRGFGSRFPTDPSRNEFTFGPQDEVIITMPGTTEFNATLVVGPNGSIRVPFLSVGELLVGGLTEDEVERKIEALLATDFVDNDVIVSKGVVRSKKIYVGALNPQNGGLIFRALPWKGDYTLFELWVDIQSPSTVLDDDRHIRVIRADPRNPVVYVINVREIALEGRSGANIQLQPNDIVFVPPTLLGQINRLISTVALPLQSLNRITGSILSARRAIDVIEGNDRFVRFRGNF